MTHFGAAFHGIALSELYDDLPDRGMAYNSRQLEMECANIHGIMDLGDWYAIPLIQREWKVAAMIVPRLLSAMESDRQAKIMEVDTAR